MSVAGRVRRRMVQTLFFSDLEVEALSELWQEWFQAVRHDDPLCWTVDLDEPYALHALKALSQVLGCLPVGQSHRQSTYWGFRGCSAKPFLFPSA